MDDYWKYSSPNRRTKRGNSAGCIITNFFNDDCPEQTEEQLKKFRRVNPELKIA